MFNKVKEAITNAIENGYEPLVMSAQELAADLVEKASEFAEDSIEDVTTAAEQVKQYFENKHG